MNVTLSNVYIYTNSSLSGESKIHNEKMFFVGLFCIFSQMKEPIHQRNYLVSPLNLN